MRQTEWRQCLSLLIYFPHNNTLPSVNHIKKGDFCWLMALKAHSQTAKPDGRVPRKYSTSQETGSQRLPLLVFLLVMALFPVPRPVSYPHQPSSTLTVTRWLHLISSKSPLQNEVHTTQTSQWESTPIWFSEKTNYILSFTIIWARLHTYFLLGSFNNHMIRETHLFIILSQFLDILTIFFLYFP